MILLGPTFTMPGSHEDEEWRRAGFGWSVVARVTGETLGTSVHSVSVRAVIQRVSEASVAVDGNVVGAIGTGLLVLVGVTGSDGQADAEALADKLARLRIFRDDDGKMNRSVTDVGGAVLVVSQFTLYGSVRRGNRPSFVDAAEPSAAEPLVEVVTRRLEGHGLEVATGRFGAMMDVHLVNDGPVTITLDVTDGRIQ